MYSINFYVFLHTFDFEKDKDRQLPTAGLLFCDVVHSEFHFSW